MNKIILSVLRLQVTRYAALGILINAAGFFLYLTLVQSAKFIPIASISIVYISVCTCSYFGNKIWTFRDQSRISRSAPRYFAAQVSGYVINIGIMEIFNGILRFPHAWVQFFAICSVSLFLFISTKYLVFKQGSDND